MSIVVHLGFPKTGTTSLQQALKNERCAVTGMRAGAVVASRMINAAEASVQAMFDNSYSDCECIFISYEEALFEGLRPRRRFCGELVVGDWREALKEFFEWLSLYFPKRKIEIVYSVRDVDKWLLSAYAQNYDSHYWLDGLNFRGFSDALRRGAPEILSTLNNEDSEVFDKFLSNFGTPVRINSAEILELLHKRGIALDVERVKDKANSRGMLRQGCQCWRSKPITVGQAMARIARQRRTGEFSIPDWVFRLGIFRHVSIGYFLIDEKGIPSFVFRLRFCRKVEDSQPLGLIASRV